MFQLVRSRTVNEVVVAVLLLGAAFLLVEVRFEHREVLSETWVAWVPIACSALVLVVGTIALALWRRGGRRVLTVLFALAFVVGTVGIWFHSDGHPFAHVGKVLSAWLLRPGQSGGVPVGTEPPALAPAAFCGLGLLGLIACLTPPRNEER
ncbi:MAG TPA: hypothetical protein VG496_03505 [Myxococcales bacterium]|nr:hypothetical protein [Myxococcales bacterium]